MNNQTIKSPGWAIIETHGLIKNELARLRRRIKSHHGGRTMGGGVYALPGVAGYDGLKKIVEDLRSLETRETSFNAIYITQKQWSDQHIVHGLPQRDT